MKIRYEKLKIANKKIKKQKNIQIVQKFIEEENSYEKKLEILKNTTNINLFFDTLKSINNVDKELLEKNLIDRCFQNIDFENIEELKDLYMKLKLYKNNMSNKTINYYNKLFKYCIDEYVDKK